VDKDTTEWPKWAPLLLLSRAGLVYAAYKILLFHGLLHLRGLKIEKKKNLGGGTSDWQVRVKSSNRESSRGESAWPIFLLTHCKARKDIYWCDQAVWN
jgi:hypothetical protein